MNQSDNYLTNCKTYVGVAEDLGWFTASGKSKERLELGDKTTKFAIALFSNSEAGLNKNVNLQDIREDREIYNKYRNEKWVVIKFQDENSILHYSIADISSIARRFSLEQDDVLNWADKGILEIELQNRIDNYNIQNYLNSIGSLFKNYQLIDDYNIPNKPIWNVPKSVEEGIGELPKQITDIEIKFFANNMINENLHKFYLWKNKVSSTMTYDICKNIKYQIQIEVLKKFDKLSRGLIQNLTDENIKNKIKNLLIELSQINLYTFSRYSTETEENKINSENSIKSIFKKTLDCLHDVRGLLKKKNSEKYKSEDILGEFLIKGLEIQDYSSLAEKWCYVNKWYEQIPSNSKTTQRMKLYDDTKNLTQSLRELRCQGVHISKFGNLEKAAKSANTFLNVFDNLSKKEKETLVEWITSHTAPSGQGAYSCLKELYDELVDLKDKFHFNEKNILNISQLQSILDEAFRLIEHDEILLKTQLPNVLPDIRDKLLEDVKVTDKRLISKSYKDKYHVKPVDFSAMGIKSASQILEHVKESKKKYIAINISGIPFSSKEFSELLEYLPHLEILIADRCQLDSEALQLITKCESLKKLSIQNNSFTGDEFIQFLIEIGTLNKLKTLKLLDCSNNNISDKEKMMSQNLGKKFKDLKIIL